MDSPKNPDYNSVKRGEIVNTSGVCGSIYQVKLLMLFLERGFHYKIPFKLTTELKEAEKFDDLFFENTEKKEFYLLQAKHKSNESYKIRFEDLINSDYSSNYNLVKYLYSYLYSKENPLFANGTIKQVLMFTNANFDLDSKFKGATLSGYVEKIEHTDEILNFAHDIVKSQLAQYRFKPEIKPLLRPYIERFMFSKIDHVSDDDVDDFLDKFIFAVGQPNEEELDVIIKNDLVKFSVFKNYVNFKNSIYNNYLNLMLNWYKSGKKTFGENGYLHHEGIRSIFQLLMKELKKLELQAFSLELLTKVDDFTIKYKPEAICNIKQFLTSSKKILNITSDYKTLTSIKVVQACKEETKSKDDCIFLKSSESHLFERVMNVFESDVNLLIVVNNHDGNTLKLFEQLQALLELYNDKKIIFIGEENRILIEEIETLKKEDYVVIQDHNYDLIESKEQLAGRVEVFFEGEKFKLNELFIDKIDPFNADLLSKLVNNEKIELGKQVSLLENDGNFYTDRYLYQKSSVDLQFFKVDKSSVFVFDGTRTFSTLCKDKSLKWLCGDEPMIDFENININEHRNVRFIFISSVDNFNSVCKYYPHQNIHWFEIKYDQSLSWRVSDGSLNELLNYLTKRHVQAFDKFEYKVNILCAEPGMGKSTYLLQVGKKLKHSFTSLPDTKSSLKFPNWVILIKLNKHTKKLSVTKFNNNLKIVIEFLIDILNLESELEKKLFRCSFYGGPIKLDLLFDDFDEICPDHKEACVELFKLIKKSAVNHLIIATRPYTVQKELEKELNTPSHYLYEFTEEQSKEYLLQFWQNSLNLLNVDEPEPTKRSYIFYSSKSDKKRKPEKFATNVLEKFKTHFKKGEIDFISFPLHLAMIAELFESKLKDYLESKFDDVEIEQLNLYNLYEKFIKEKYFKIHCGSKQAKDLTNPTIKITEKKMFSVFLHDHQLLACYSLLRDQFLSYMLTNTEINKEIPELMKEIEDGEFKVGLIDTVVNNKPHFVHKTYEEFFVARLLLNKFCSIPLDGSGFEKFVLSLSKELNETSHIHAYELFANVNKESLTNNSIDFKDFKKRLIVMFGIIAKCRYETTEAHTILYQLIENFILDLQLISPIHDEVKKLNDSQVLNLLCLLSVEKYSKLLGIVVQFSFDSLDRNEVQEDLKTKEWNDTVVWYYAHERNFKLLQKIILNKKLYNVEWVDKNGRNLLNAIIEFENKDYSSRILLSCIDANVLCVNHSSSDTELNEDTLLLIKCLKNNDPVTMVHTVGKHIDFDYIRTFNVKVPECSHPVNGEKYLMHYLINYLENKINSLVNDECVVFEHCSPECQLPMKEVLQVNIELVVFGTLIRNSIRNGAFYEMEDFNDNSVKSTLDRLYILYGLFEKLGVMFLGLDFQNPSKKFDTKDFQKKYKEIRRILIKAVMTEHLANDPKTSYKICSEDGFVVLKPNIEPRFPCNIFLFPDMFEGYFHKALTTNNYDGEKYINSIWRRIDACFDRQDTIQMKCLLAFHDLTQIISSTSDKLLKGLCQRLQFILTKVKMQCSTEVDIDNLKVYVYETAEQINLIAERLKEKKYKPHLENHVRSKDVFYILSMKDGKDQYDLLGRIDMIYKARAGHLLQKMLDNLDKYRLSVMCKMQLQHYLMFLESSLQAGDQLITIDNLFIEGVTDNYPGCISNLFTLKDSLCREVALCARNSDNLTLIDLAWKKFEKDSSYVFMIEVLEKYGAKREAVNPKLVKKYEKLLSARRSGCYEID